MGKINENESTKKFEEMATPDVCYESIKCIESLMDDSIHDLVWQYGKRVNDGDYEFNMYDKHFKDYCIISDKNAIKRIKKCIILCPEKCQVRGHLFFETTDGEQLAFCQLDHQEFNVYSHIYRMVKDIINKQKK